MSDLIFTKEQKKVRRQWLCLTFFNQIISPIITLYWFANEANIAIYLASLILPSILLILYYFDSYRKPGTGGLSAQLLFMCLSSLRSLPFLFDQITNGGLMGISISIFGLSIAAYVIKLNLNMRIINKEIQLKKTTYQSSLPIV